MKRPRSAIHDAFSALWVVIFLAALFPLPSHAGGLDNGIAVSDTRGVRVEMVIPAPGLEKPAPSGNPFTRIRVPGWATTSRVGAPALPTLGFLVQVPPTGALSIVAEGGRQVILPDMVPSPCPDRRLMEDGSVSEEAPMDAAIYAGGSPFPQSLAEIHRIGTLRGIPLARVLVSPFQWDPSRRELRYPSRLTLRVAFEEPLQEGQGSVWGSSAPGDGLTAILEKEVVNLRPSAAGTQGVQGGRGGEAAFPRPAKGILRIGIEETGIYRITWDDLKEAGVPVRTIDPRTLRVENLGEEIAIRVVTRKKRFLQGDYLAFYGQAMDNAFTDTNIYWLSWGGSPGKRMAVLDGTVTGEPIPPAWFTDTLRFEENHVLWGLTPGAPDVDYWFWEKIDAPTTKNHPFSLPSIADAEGTAILRVDFRGRTTASPHPNHHTRISIDGTLVGDETWDGSVAHTQEMEVPLSLLGEGTHTLSVHTPGDTGASVDTVYLNGFTFLYPRRFEAVDNVLAFPLEGSGRAGAAIQGLTSPQISVYDVSDPLNVAIYIGYTVEGAAGIYTLRIEDLLEGKKSLYAAGDGALKKPSSLEIWQSPDLRNTGNRADLLLITPKALIPALDPLIQSRKAQGLAARAVALEDIYNTFNHGLTDPRAIRDFVACAYGTWSPPAPSHVLLLGDATYDYRGYLGTGKASVVPVHLTYTSGLGITPDDAWYVAVDGEDALPDLMIGRIPASGEDAGAAAVQKLIAYETSGIVSQKALYVADNNELAFEEVNEAFIGLLPEGVTPERVYLRSYPNTDAATQAVLGYFEEGMSLVSYVGHGDVTHWAGEGILVPEDIALLQNRDRLPLVATFDCLNGFFAHPSTYAIGEAFVVPPEAGAIAAFSPSGLGYTWEHELLGEALFTALFEDNLRMLGPLTTGAKLTAYARGASLDIVRVFTLFGDPSLTLKGGD